MLYVVRCVVYLRYDGGKHGHDRADRNAERNGEENELSVLVHGALKLTRSEELTDDDGDRRTHGEERAEEEIRHRA